MLHILWTLLKFILILLGILLGLILVAVLLILFCPVRYRASGTKETDSFRDISARARVSWLFGVVSFQLQYQNGTSAFDFRLFGIPIMKLIQKEKRIELSFENCRYFDVRRWGLTNEFFNKPVHGMNVNYDGNEFYKRTEITSRNFDRQYFFPIPQSEIDIDKNLVQNEGF